MPSPPGSVEPPVPCARCLKKVPRLQWGDLCAECRAELVARATPLARGISFLAALLVVGYAVLRIPLGPTSRVWVGAAAIGTYFLVRKIALAVAMEVRRH